MFSKGFTVHQQLMYMLTEVQGFFRTFCLLWVTAALQLNKRKSCQNTRSHGYTQSRSTDTCWNQDGLLLRVPHEKTCRAISSKIPSLAVFTTSHEMSLRFQERRVSGWKSVRNWETEQTGSAADCLLGVKVICVSEEVWWWVGLLPPVHRFRTLLLVS